MKALPRSASVPNLVIGSGAGGLTTAITLARAGKRVVVLEEGSQKSEAAPFSLSEIQSDYRNGGQVLSLGLNPLVFGEGKLLGGGTAVNSGYYLRPHLEKLEDFGRAWELEDFSSRSLDEDFLALEQEISPVSVPDCDWLSREQWTRASESAGLEVEEAKFAHRWNPVTKTLERRSLFTLWGDELRALGTELILGCRATKIRKEGAAWRVEVRSSEGHLSSIKAENIFLGAGAIQSPALLRRSGFRRNIGENFQFHIFVRALARFPRRVNEGRCPLFPWKAVNGSVTIGHSPDQAHLLALAAPELRETLKREWPHWTAFYASVPTTRGKRIRHWGTEPVLFAGLCREERQSAEDAFRLLKRFISSLGAESPAPARFSAGSLQSVHLFGSCPMGGNPRSSAVDSWGRLHEDKSMRICDASILGSALGQNPQAVIMAMARRNARHFLGAQP